MAEYSAETPVLTLEGGKKYPDFLRHFSRGAVFSRRAVEVFLEAGVTGIEYSPVTVGKGTRILRKDNRILLI
jgi:hypothetical protein